MKEYNAIDLIEAIRGEVKENTVEHITLAEVIRIKPLVIKVNGMIIEEDQLYMLNGLYERQRGRNTTADAKHSHAVIYNKLKVSDTLLVYYFPDNVIIIDKVVALHG